MFKSIEKRLFIYLALLIVTTGLSVWLFFGKQWVYGSVALLGVVFSLVKIWSNYRKFNLNILFLLNALENGDYSFHFSMFKMSKREKELNAMMNRIKAIVLNARREVIEDEEFLSLVVESVPTGIVIFNENGSVLKTNAAAMQLLGLNVFTHIKQLAYVEPRLPHDIERLIPGTTLQVSIVNEREETMISLRQNHLQLKRGRLRVVTLSNIGSELEAQEMESWVKLIRVMTHEIMNSIAPISSLSSTMLDSYREISKPDALSATAIEAFDTISSTAKGLLNFVESYRQFTGVPKPQVRRVELEGLLSRIVKLDPGALSARGIKLEIHHITPGTIAMIDEGQITQVLVNLVKNAAEAVGNNEGGMILLEAGESDSRPYIVVSNNGEPISRETLPHIFVPFFTTKSQGSGIGLSISRYIMRLHGGNLSHHYAAGWTSFRLTF